MSGQDDCWSCAQHAAPEPPPREQVVLTEHWHAAHAFNSTLPGWLVLLPNRHVGAFTDLTAAEAAEIGPLVHRLSTALTEVTGCVKTYLMQFSEAEPGSAGRPRRERHQMGGPARRTSEGVLVAR